MPIGEAAVAQRLNSTQQLSEVASHMPAASALRRLGPFYRPYPGLLAGGLALVIVRPIPGQEERNADHLLEAGVAIRCNNLPALAWKIDRLLEDPARLAAMRANARRMARPQAAGDIAATLLDSGSSTRRLCPQYVRWIPAGRPAFAPQGGPSRFSARAALVPDDHGAASREVRVRGVLRR